nr:adenylate/guanylate cyclase domain-containing protein [Endobacter medicaginis]
MRQDPQVAAFYLANSDGDFELVQRAAEGATDTIVVTDKTPDHARTRTETRTDESGRVTAQPPQPSTYDPRKSPYYRGAMRQPVEGGSASVLPDGSTVYWSAPYLFKPTSQPVITASIGYTDPGDSRDHVLAVNIALDRMSAFLARLKIGEHGHAMILDRAGQIIAAPPLADAHDDPTAWRLDHGITDPRLADDADLVRAFDLFRVQGFGPQSFVLHGVRYISLAARLPGAAPDWVLLLSVPARDFAAFSAADTRSTFVSLLVILLLAAGLAGVLIWQGLRSDRLVAALDARNARGSAEREALHALLSEPHLLDAAVAAPGLTERLAEAAGAARASIWRLVHDGTVLRCDDLYDARSDTHAGGAELQLESEEDFADARAREAGFAVDDAAADPRTRRYWRQVMRAAETRALLAVPVTGADRTAAMLLIENPTRIGETEGLIDMIGGIVALRLHDEAERTPAPTPTPAGALPATHETRTDPLGDNLLLDPGADGAAPTPGLFPSVAIMVLAFGDSGVEDTPSTDQTLHLVDDIASGLQDIARRHGLFSVKVAGHRLVAAAGCTPEPDPQAPIRLALAAIAIRDLCLSRLSAADIDPAFQIGLDVGPTFGAELGREPSVFNLWGETVRVAEAMAQSNPQPGSIQVTEGMYILLRQHFLFRTRGSFYTPRGGVSRAYILAGRQ